ncbi:hypothetical protein ACWJJH_00580 [Endozoicomonadaceae bacterium StTr2]
MYFPALKKIFLNLIAGHYGLAKTYWLYGLAAMFAINEVLEPITVTLLGSYAGCLFIPLQAGYLTAAAVGVFRAANRFRGNPVWPFLAKMTTGFAMLTLLLSLMELATP